MSADATTLSSPRACALLISVQVRQILASFGLSRAARSAAGEKGARSQRSVHRFALLVVGVLLVVAVLMVYLFLLGAGLAVVGAADLIPPVAVIVGSLTGVVFTFVKANGTLFGFRDYDLTMALPVSMRVVVVSRVAALFATEIGVAALTMLPLYAAYFALGGPGLLSVPAVLVALASVVLAPLAPTSVAIFVSFAITAVSARFRHANAVYLVVGALALLVVFFVPMVASFSIKGMDDSQFMGAMASTAAALRSQVLGLYPPAAWLSSALGEGSLVGLALFVAVSVLAPVACVEVLARNFMAINAATSATAARKDFTADKLSARRRTPLVAMTLKEFRCMVGIPTYAFNALFGDLIMVVLSVAMAVVGVRSALSAISVNGAPIPAEYVDLILEPLYLALPWVAAFFCICAPSAACALSLEGRSNWIMATAPVSAGVVLGSKLLANVAHAGAALAVSLVVLVASGEVAPLLALEVALVALGALLLCATVSQAVDAARPNYQWSSPVEPIKRGLPMMVGVLGGMLVVFAAGFGATALGMAVGPVWGHALSVALGLAFLAVAALVFRRSARIEKLYI